MDPPFICGQTAAYALTGRLFQGSLKNAMTRETAATVIILTIFIVQYPNCVLNNKTVCFPDSNDFSNVGCVCGSVFSWQGRERQLIQWEASTNMSWVLETGAAFSINASRKFKLTSAT
jgi:hypothetical protein